MKQVPQIVALVLFCCAVSFAQSATEPDRGLALIGGLAAGGTVLFGTDVGYMADYNPGEEYELMARAGMDFQQILKSLTTEPSAQFSTSPGGHVAVGFPADLVVLNQDPSRNVRAFVDVRYTIREGKLTYMQKSIPLEGLAKR